MPYNSHKNRKRIVKPNARRAFILNDVIRLANWYARRADRNTSADDGAAKFLHDNAVEFDKIIDSIVYWSNRKPVKNRLRPWRSLTPTLQKKWEDKLIRKAVKLQTKQESLNIGELLQLAAIRAPKYVIGELHDKIDKYTHYQRVHDRSGAATPNLRWSFEPKCYFRGTVQERYNQQIERQLHSVSLDGQVIEVVPNLHPDDTDLFLDPSKRTICATISNKFYKLTRLLDRKVLAGNVYIDQGSVKVFYVAVLIKSRMTAQQKAQGLVANIDWCPFSISRGYIGSFIDTKTGKQQSTSLYKTAAKALSAAREQVAASFADSLSAEEEEERA